MIEDLSGGKTTALWKNVDVVVIVSLSQIPAGKT